MDAVGVVGVWEVSYTVNRRLLRRSCELVKAAYHSEPPATALMTELPPFVLLSVVYYCFTGHASGEFMKRCAP